MWSVKNYYQDNLFERNEIVPFLAGYPQVMANEHDELISLKDLKKYLQEYNTWYRRKKRTSLR